MLPSAGPKWELDVNDVAGAGAGAGLGLDNQNEPAARKADISALVKRRVAMEIERDDRLLLKVHVCRLHVPGRSVSEPDVSVAALVTDRWYRVSAAGDIATLVGLRAHIAQAGRRSGRGAAAVRNGPNRHNGGSRVQPEEVGIDQQEVAMSDINMVLVGTGAPAEVAALTAAGVTCIGVADNFHQSPGAVSTMLRAWRGSAQLVVVDQNHATPPILAMIDWPAVVVLDSPSAPSVYAARRRRLNFVVSNPVLHSMPAAGWRRIANLVGGPRTAKIEYYSLDVGEELAVSRGLLGQLVGVACELLGLPTVDSALSLPAAAHSASAAVLFQTRKMLYIMVQQIHGPKNRPRRGRA